MIKKLIVSLIKGGPLELKDRNGYFEGENSEELLQALNNNESYILIQRDL